jgi:hypothetical protein
MPTPAVVWEKETKYVPDIKCNDEPLAFKDLDYDLKYICSEEKRCSEYEDVCVEYKEGACKKYTNGECIHYVDGDCIDRDIFFRCIEYEQICDQWEQVCVDYTQVCDKWEQKCKEYGCSKKYAECSIGIKNLDTKGGNWVVKFEFLDLNGKLLQSKEDVRFIEADSAETLFAIYYLEDVDDKVRCSYEIIEVGKKEVCKETIREEEVDVRKDMIEYKSLFEKWGLI